LIKTALVVIYSTANKWFHNAKRVATAARRLKIILLGEVNTLLFWATGNLTDIDNFSAFRETPTEARAGAPSVGPQVHDFQLTVLIILAVFLAFFGSNGRVRSQFFNRKINKGAGDIIAFVFVDDFDRATEKAKTRKTIIAVAVTVTFALTVSASTVSTTSVSASTEYVSTSTLAETTAPFSRE